MTPETPWTAGAARRAGPRLTLALALLLAGALAGCGGDSSQSLMASGQNFLDKKDPRSAVIQFKAALQRDPQSAEARFRLGEALLASGDPTSAAVELGKALDQKLSAARVMPLLARALLLSGDYKKLATVYGDLVLEDPTAQAALKVAAATAWGALGDRPRTEAAVAAALAAVPGYGPALLIQARIRAGQRDFDGALAIVDQTLARDPNLYEAWLLKGEILVYARKDVAGGDEAFRRALALEKAYVPAHLALIASRLRARDIPAAKAQADQLRAVLPRHPQTLFVDAQIAFFDRDLVKAREQVQQLLKVAPDHVGVLQLAGAVEGQIGSVVVAESYFAKALQINPELPLARRNLAQAYLRLGQAEKSLETLQPLLGPGATDAQAQGMAGEAELRLGDPAAAEAHFKAAAQLAPDDTQLRTAVALANLTRGDPSTAFNELESLAASSKDSYADQGLIGARMKRLEYDAALAAAERMNRKLPGQALGYELLGRIQVARKQYGPARLAFEQALKLDPGLFAATASLAAMDLIEKNPAQARQRLEAATEADPRNPFALMALAELKASTGAPIDESKTLLAQAIKAAPSEAAPRLQLIELLLKKRLYKEALAAAQEAAVALPGDVHVLDTVGRAQMEAGDVEQSIGTFRRLAAASPKSALAYTRLADVFKASGRREQSEVVLRKALEIEPDLEQAQVELVNLLVAGNRANDALEFTRHLQRDRPKQPAGYWLEAWVHFKSHRPDAAVATLRAGLAKLEGSSSLARSLYKTLTDIGRQAEADQFGTAWMKAHPKDLAFDYELASSDIRRHRLEQAEARLLRIVAARPDHPLALNNLAWVLAARGRPGAVGYAQRAVDLLPRRPALMDTLALALAAEKQPDKALAMQKEAVELAPTDNGLHLGLARIALQAGDKVLARKELERLLALGPAFTARADVEQLMKEL